MVSGPAGRTMVRVNHSSRGLFFLPDGRLAHFTMQFERDHPDADVVFGVEIFEANGSFVGYGRAQGISPFKKGDSLVLSVLAVDAFGRIFLTDQRSGAPVLRVMRLHY